MKFVLLTMGAYSDQTNLGLIGVPNDLDVQALITEFKAIWDHGMKAVKDECYSQVMNTLPNRINGSWIIDQSALPIQHTRPCNHTRQEKEILAWRKSQGWDGYDCGEYVVEWLVKEHGCVVVEYSEVHLGDC